MTTSSPSGGAKESWLEKLLNFGMIAVMAAIPNIISAAIVFGRISATLENQDDQLKTYSTRISKIEASQYQSGLDVGRLQAQTEILMVRQGFPSPSLKAP